MRECAQTAAIVEAWEDQGNVSEAELASLKEHLTTCPSCARRHALLMSLFQRDASTARGGRAGEGAPGFADRVMSRIGTATPRMAFPAPVWIAAAAACLLLAAGIGLAAARLNGGPSGADVVVRFVLDAPGAKSVALAGSFGGWSITRFPMSDPNRDGVWEIDVRLKRDSISTYNFVIDGSRWVADPRSQTRVDDGFGGESSVLRL